MTHPVIGITLDSEDSGGYSRFPWYAVRQNYGKAVTAAGGLPVMLPHFPEQVDVYLDQLSGLVITGGAFDVDPLLYGEAERHGTVALKSYRTSFEWGMAEGALGRGMPILGICGGQQLLNVVLGGTLIQHIPDEVPDALEHEQPNPRDEPGHDVTIVADTLLHHIADASTIAVNSAHHQAVKQTGPGVIINAVAPDGVIEGIEFPRHDFCVGVQWHPEFQINVTDKRIFQAFVDAARRTC